MISKMQPVSPSVQNVGGYLGQWMKKNITHELLEFPLEEYLLPYYTSGLIIKHWSGEDFVGKYFQGLAYAYQYCDALFPDDCMQRMLKNRMDQVIRALLTFYKRDDHTVLLTMTDPPCEFDEEWRLFTVKYGLLILLTYYDLFGDQRTLDAAVAIGDRMLEEYDPEHGKPINVEGRSGIEGFTELYRFTGEQKYLDFCYHIMRSRVEKEFVTDVLQFGGELFRIPACHSYTVLATYIGILELLELDPSCPQTYLEACELAVHDIVQKRWNAVGGISTSEHFKPDGVLGITPGDRPNEACANAYFMRMCLKLFWLTGKPEYVDYFEHTLYNIGLGCKNPRDPFLTSYYTPLQGFHIWKKIHLTNGTPCCPASMSREIARITDMLWAHRKNEIAVLLYNEAEMQTEVDVSGEAVAVRCSMHTNFPANGDVDLQVAPEQPAEFTLSLRIPSWCKAFAVKLPDGTTQKGQPGSFLKLKRLWNPDDRLTIRMELSVRLIDGQESFPGYRAIARGPQVMAVDARVNSKANLDELRLEMDKPHVLDTADAEALPVGWCGDAVYRTPMLEDVLLTPFAHTGQMKAGDRYHTLIREKDGWITVDDPQLSYDGAAWRKEVLHLDDYFFIPYHGNRPLDWLDDRCTDSYYGGSCHRSMQEGDSACYTFCGTAIEVYGCVLDYPDRKICVPCVADFYVDDVLEASVTYTEHQFQKRIFKKLGMKRGYHTVKIVCRGSVMIDYLRYV